MTENESSTSGQRLLEGLFERLFRDPAFANTLERDPEQALRDFGIELDQDQVEEIRRVRAQQQEEESLREAAILPAVLVAVRVYTSPAVQVAVRTIFGDQQKERVLRDFGEVRDFRAEDEA